MHKDNLQNYEDSNGNSQFRNSSLSFLSKQKIRKPREVDAEESADEKEDLGADPVFFSAYGGDIEYFFPLISFGKIFASLCIIVDKVQLQFICCMN